MERLIFKLTSDYYKMIKVNPTPSAPGVLSQAERQLLLEQERKRWDKLLKQFEAQCESTTPQE